jgi:GT2 family glycosyltransferase
MEENFVDAQYSRDSPIEYSVVIPTYNRNEMLIKCLDALAPGTQTLDFSLYEVIVTDDEKENNTKKLISEFYSWVKWVQGPGKGPAANRNNGARNTNGQWLIFMDDDCIPDSNCLVAYREAMKNYPSIEVFEGRIYVNKPRKSLAEISPINENGGKLWSCNFAIKKSLFYENNGFNEKFQYPAMEDVEFHYRLKKKGSKIIFLKEAGVMHPWRHKGGWKKLTTHVESTLVYLELHPEERKKINSKYYLKYALKSFFKETIPGAIQYRLRGLGTALQQHIFEIYTTIIFALKKKI